MNYRLIVEKREGFQVEAHSLCAELNENLGLKMHTLRCANIYDLFGFSPALLEKCQYTIFGEKVTDNVSVVDIKPIPNSLAVEFVPGQFDQRASSAVDCVHLIDPNADVKISSGRLLIFDDTVGEKELAKIRRYYINAVECREKDMSRLSFDQDAEVKPLVSLNHFTEMIDDDMEVFCREWGLAMNVDDLKEVVRYFQSEKRQPTETEIRILDTYWSDHCRHTTFTTELETIRIDDSFIKEEIENTLGRFYNMRRELGREQKPLCLMELATIGARYLKTKGLLDDLETSEENNACSIYVDVDVDGQKEKWLLQFKNETHNHPTEIEPFGGASTCLGGAIRDPLSGRAYVYQAMRVTGAGNIYTSIEDTLAGKLPQQIISRKAASGYSSYGNQIGLAATHIREIYHPSYVAKRMEVGAVVGAVKAENVRRESPVAGDVILLLGGRTGRDGIGGATGASKEHKESSLDTCGSEVQKGNAPEERKLQHLFRRSEVTQLIKKSNDFGAGGVSVAIGELADGLDIYLDRVPAKYAGLNPTELAISESQERMAVVIEAKDENSFVAYCKEENIEVTHVADVTDTGRMRQFFHGTVIADLRRDFIDSAGARHYAKATIGAVSETTPFHSSLSGSIQDRMCVVLSSPNVVSQKGMIEMFDSTIGRSTVLMPFGGKTQLSETQVSVQKLPTSGFTNTASLMAFGFNPFISEWSPYHGAAYAVVEACAKAVAAGADYAKMRFSYQEYFERMTENPHSYGKPLAALLGALKMQDEFCLPAIGGKDSMSGTFEHISVPPTLIAFGVTTVDANHVISPELKQAGHRLYLLRHVPLATYMPNTEQLKRNWTFLTKEIHQGHVCAAYALGFGGLAEALAKCCFGNELGVDVKINIDELADYQYGSILVETTCEIEYELLEYLGKVADTDICINGEILDRKALYEASTMKYSRIYPTSCVSTHRDILPPNTQSHTTNNVFDYLGAPIQSPLVYIPVFPGTNCDYDVAKAFRAAGAKVESEVFCNLTSDDIANSISSMSRHIDKCQILALAGGFSAGDEPDGSGKFIANILSNRQVADAIERLIARGGLILGICNGFQALVKSGLLPYGKIGLVTSTSPTLFRNDINRHISQMVTTRVNTTASPWLKGFHVGDLHTIAVSHGEGKFVVNEEEARRLFENGQVAFQYANPATGEPTMVSPMNPNGAYYAIEGIISPNGQILGKMGHSERYETNLFKNIEGNLYQSIFENAVNYFRKTSK